jgi:methyl-accepting chemotaxis protein
MLMRNTRYLETYRLSPEIGRKIIEDLRTGQNTTFYVPAADGCVVQNLPLPSGGFVSTHEDVTEQRRAEEVRAAVQHEQQRCSLIETAIRGFRNSVEALLGRVS